MCGIIGATGGDNVLELLLQGLERLEYRGYDSAGVALQADGADGTLWRARARRAPGRWPTWSRWSRTPLTGWSPASATPAGPRTATPPRPTPTPTSTAPARRRRPQRHHRELAGADRPSSWPRAPLLLRHRHRGRRAPRRGGARRVATSLADAVRTTRARAARGVRPRGRVRRRAGHHRGGPSGVAARRRPGRRDGAGLLASDIPALLKRTRRFWVIDDDQVVELRPGAMRVTTLAGKVVEPTERVTSTGISRPPRRAATRTS